MLLPLEPGSALSSPDWHGSPVEYLRALPNQGYLFIKAVLPWMPLGLLAGIEIRTRFPSFPSAILAILLVLVVVFTPTAKISDLLEAIYVIPGLALGLWLSGCISSTLAEARPRFVRAVVTAEADVPTRQHGEAKKRRQRHPAGATHGPAGLSLPRLLSGAFLLLLAVVGLVNFPLGQASLAALLFGYAVLLWFVPLAWLVLVPAALPLLDFAPWSGRFFVDEFDLMMLVTAGTLFLRAARWPRIRLHPAWLFFALCGASLLISAVIGLGSPPPLDANAFSSYWSPYNSLRVAKGIFWGGLAFMLLLLSRPEPATLARLLSVGMGVGLLGVGLVGLWERWLFAGFASDTHTYRIVSTFSSMHTGGGHIEAYLVAALPFLWLGMGRWKTLTLAVPVMALTVYAILFTVARGGVLALGLVLLTLGMASVRLAWCSGQRRRAAIPIGVLALLAAGMLVGMGGGYFQQRLAQSGEDWQIRVDHWKQAVSMMDATPMAQLFGMGLGSFPRIYLERGPADKQPATFGFLREKDNTFLRLGSGDTLYYAQRVGVRAGEHYHLELDARSHQQGARIETPVCEKQLLNSRRCVWISKDVPADGRWHRLSHDFSSAEVGVEEGLRRPPVELFLYYPDKAGRIDVDNVRLLDASGANLVGNGGFTWGGDYWFFKTHSHLPWHIKNVWVHVLFEQGWLGLSLFTALVAFALARLARKAWSGEGLAWVWLASLLGLLTVGMFDSLFDAPRLAMLLTLLCLLGVAYEWNAMPPAPRRKKHHSRRSHQMEDRTPTSEVAPLPDAVNRDQINALRAR